MDIILFIFGAIGLTHIIVDNDIMLPVRNVFDKYLHPKVAKLVHCYQCSGFWCGMFSCWAAYPSATLWQIIIGGFAGSFLANFLAVFMNYIEAATYIHMPPENEGK